MLNSDRAAKSDLVEVERAVQASLSESREIVRQYQTARRKINVTMQLSRRLREESEALWAAWTDTPG